MLKNIRGYGLLDYPSYVHVRETVSIPLPNEWLWIWWLSRACVPEAVPWFVLPAVCSWSTSSSRSKTVSLLCVLLGHYHDQRRPACCCFCSAVESQFWLVDPGDWWYCYLQHHSPTINRSEQLHYTRYSNAEHMKTIVCRHVSLLFRYKWDSWKEPLC